MWRGSRDGRGGPSPPYCHSERSEESLFVLSCWNGEIPRHAACLGMTNIPTPGHPPFSVIPSDRTEASGRGEVRPGIRTPGTGESLRIWLTIGVSGQARASAQQKGQIRRPSKMFHVERCGKFFELWEMLRTAKLRSKRSQNPRKFKIPQSPGTVLICSFLDSSVSRP
jgi:hypothetical protein